MTTMDIGNKNNFSRKAYRPEFQARVLEFARDHGLPPHQTQATFKRFLTQLCSGPEKIVQIYSGETLVAAGVLLDLVKNPGHTTPFELLGLDQKYAEGAYQALLTAAERELPRHSKGMTVFHHFMHPFGDELLLNRGYTPYINTYSMMLRNPRDQEIHIPATVRVEPLKIEFIDFYYEMVRDVFSQSPEVSIPAREEFRRATMLREIPPLLVYESRKLAGFVTISVDERDRSIGHIDTLGVPAQMRHKGLGRLLLQNAIQALLIEKVTRINLDVSAENPQALKLYESMGFQVVDRFAGFKLAHPA